MAVASVKSSTVGKANLLLLAVIALAAVHIAYNMYVVVLTLEDILDTISDFIDLVLDMNLFYQVSHAAPNEPDVDAAYQYA